MVAQSTKQPLTRRRQSWVGRRRLGRPLFEAQQAAEKAIKAVLVCRGVVFPKTHVISELITLLQQSGLEVPERVRESAVLTPYAILTRYPGFPESISEENYASAIELAERVYRWAESLIV